MHRYPTRFTIRATALALCLWLSGCASMAPPFETTASSYSSLLPSAYSHAAQPASAGQSLAADLDWHAYFADPALQRLIGQALAHNRDLRIAALRVREAQAAHDIQRSARLPTAGLGADATRARTPADLSATGSALIGKRFQAGLGISSWEIDFWGRIASLDEAALQGFLATEAARRAVAIGLVAQVANTWLGLRELDERLRLARASEASQRESLRIFTRRFEVGAASRLELTQVQTLLAQAESLVVQLRQQREAQALALSLLLGDVKDGVENMEDATTAAGTPAPLDMDTLPSLAPGLPSDLLQGRPDVLAAEHQLRAANANIGAARAAFFPHIGLTAFGGLASADLGDLFRGASRAWSFTPSLTLPLFNAGRNRANLDLAEARKNLAVAQYEQTVQNAFRDVADALSVQQGLAQQVEVQQRALAAQRERARLSRLSYDNGATSFLEVLDAERSLISAEQQLVQTRRAFLSSRIALYAALGGGSRRMDEAPPLPAPVSDAASASAPATIPAP